MGNNKWNQTCLTNFPSTNNCYVQSFTYVVFHTTAFTRTAERTVYMILNLSWFFFSLLKGVLFLWKQFLQLCFQPAKNVLYITLTCCPPHSIVLIVLFSDLYLCLETVTFWIKINLQYVVCFIFCKWKRGMAINGLESVSYHTFWHVWVGIIYRKHCHFMVLINCVF